MTYRGRAVYPTKTWPSLTEVDSNIPEVDSNIPETARASIDAYVEHGLHPGGFLLAVLQNNLFDALFLADSTNRQALYHIAQYVYNKTPGECWGSQKATTKWLSRYAGENDG